MALDGSQKASAELGSEWLRKHQVAPHLPSLSYLPDYITTDEEERLLREARASKAKWVQLSGRRLQNHGGVVHAKGLIPAPLPSWLQPLLRRLRLEGGPAGLYGGQPPNHVLVNSYFPGEGIMPHEDGPAYHPVVAILSLGAPAVLRFRRKRRADEGDDAVAAGGNGGASGAHSTDTSCNTGSRDASGTNNTHGGSSAGRNSQAGATSTGTGSDITTCAPATSPPTTISPDSGCNVAGATAGQALTACGPSDWVPPQAPQAPSSSAPAPPAAACRYTASVLLQPRSLVVFRDEAFSDCLHTIEEVIEEVLDESVANLGMYGMQPGSVLARGGERISLTVRRVARVLPAILRPRGGT